MCWAKFIASLAKRLSVGSGCPGLYLPVSTPCASGDQTICEMPLAEHSGNTSASGACHSMEYWGLGRDEQAGPGDIDGRLNLLGSPFAEAEVAGLALLHDLLERLDRVLDRHGHIEAVGLV